MSKKDKQNMVWIDMEMTGLDSKKEKIIEVAVIVTDGDLIILAEGPSLIIRQSRKLLESMDDWNKKHHKKSGLYEEVLKSKVSLKAAQKQVMAFIADYCLEGKSVLCGNSVHHDRRFLDRYMPEISQYLHYRHIDVSTIKDLVKRWYPKNKNAPEKKSRHRALDDIRESIEELKFYRKTYFKRPTKKAPKAAVS